ncbi:class I adenylate-forming enzyme family protein [Marinobacter sp. 2_MG-2023]|uniref:class I adenylate-forming enzyme family protein n=1 Tax=Marinobacter sp. 2_MG-2023 TaxID=3062679 RepID=UPI0026E25B02|nr:AMP-binding protein [Marinobacter sp. 2_MG-2023]MDO6441430.1 AMP-binding protein [Marinobacter sp. 2_MG-2023]
MNAKIPQLRAGMPRLPSEIKTRTVIDLLHWNASQYPNRLALVAESYNGPQARLTYEQLRWEIDRLADGLRQQGLQRGDNLALLVPNSGGAELILTVLAAMRIGVVPVPLNTRYAAVEQIYSINLLDCQGFVYASEFASMVEGMRQQLPHVNYYIEVGRELQGSAMSWTEIQRNGNPASGEWPLLSEDDIADIILTSGTTGHPKGVVLSHSNAIAAGVAVAGALGLVGTDVYQSGFPLFTSSGLHFNPMSIWYVGGTLVIEPRIDPRETLERLGRERATVFACVPSGYIFMLDCYDPDLHDLSQVRVFDYGGAAMGRDVIRQLKANFPHIDLRHTYGMTEASPSGTYLPGHLALDKLGSIGKAMPLNEVKVLRHDGSEVEPEEMGEICLRGPTIMRGYYGDPEATESVIRGNWLFSGDLGTVDKDGFLYFHDRSKDIIVRGGMNIGSMDVENALHDHSDVKEVAVVAIPHPKLGEDLFAFIVPHAGRVPKIDALAEFLKDRLADYKIPRRVAIVGSLPRSPSGKILKKDLRTIAVERGEAEGWL